MDFTDYSDTCIQLAPDLVNTLGSPSGTELLPTPEALRAFVIDHEMNIDGPLTEADLTAVRGLRAQLRTIFEADSEAEASQRINELIAAAGTLPHLTDHDGHWHIHYTSHNAPLVDRLAAVSGIGLAEVMARYGKERFGICGADDCGDVFVDTSKNRSRRYCNDTCSNRSNVAAHRARVRAGKP